MFQGNKSLKDATNYLKKKVKKQLNGKATIKE